MSLQSSFGKDKTEGPVINIPTNLEKCVPDRTTAHITIVDQYDIGKAANTREIPLLLSKSLLKPPFWLSGSWEVGMQRCHANFNASFEANLRITDDIHNVLIDVLIDTLL